MKGMEFSMRHIIDLSDLTDKEFNDLYKLTTNIIDRPEGYVDACRGKVLGSLFYEPSTRTNLSFSTAMMRLGGSVVGFSDPRSSSTTKGETLKDTINMVSCYADMIVMRNPREGAAKAASLYSSVPVINAGDGGHLHPTQTLADMVTILRMRGSADDMKIGLCGDLKYGRTVHSLLHFLERFHNVQVYLIAPDALKLPDYMINFLKEHNMPYCEVNSIDEALPELDVLYMTRIQRERFTSAQEYENLEGSYQLTAEKMKRAKKDMLVLHPLPRVDEIAQDVDDNPCVRKVLRDHLRAVADAAADIQNGLRLALDRAHEVIARERALFLKPAVKLRVPVCHTGCLLSKR